MIRVVLRSTATPNTKPAAGEGPFLSSEERVRKFQVVLSKRAVLSTTFLVASLSANFFNACFAQSDVLPRWTDSTTSNVKPWMRQAFEGYLKALMAAYKKAGIPWFLTLETFAGDTTEYTTVVPVMKFADLDGASVVTELLRDGGSERLSHKIARCYTAQSRQYATPQTELEINRTDVAAGIYWVETRTLVAPGKMGDYLNWLRNDYRPALEKAGVARFQVSQPIFGAAAGEIVTMRMLQNLAEIDGGAVLSRALSDEEARAIAAKSAMLVSSSKTKIVRRRTELSYSAGK
jgi:hypothetical protein